MVILRNQFLMSADLHVDREGSRATEEGTQGIIN